jgi:SAM-dependent methyltransferase
MEFMRRYFSNRNTDLETTETRLLRTKFGNREIETLETIYRIAFYKNLELSGKKVLDLGAGDKFVEVPFQKKRAEYYPLDIEHINFESDDFPYLDNYFDIVISLAVIEHITNIDHFLNQIKRCLKPGAFVYFTTPNFKYCYETFYDDPTHVRPFTEVSLKRLLNMYNFKKINVYPGLRCKPDRMYTRKDSFRHAANIPFQAQPIKYAPHWSYGKATSIICIAEN